MGITGHHESVSSDATQLRQLIAVLDAFIVGFQGSMRIRGIKTALLIQQATMEKRGISVSELARQSEAPLESVRRHIAKHVELGNLRYVDDPDDDRISRVVSAHPKFQQQTAMQIVQRLAEIDWTDGGSHGRD